QADVCVWCAFGYPVLLANELTRLVNRADHQRLSRARRSRGAPARIPADSHWRTLHPPVTTPTHVPVVDVYAHVTPQRLQRAVLSGQMWHGMSPSDGNTARLLST